MMPPEKAARVRCFRSLLLLSVVSLGGGALAAPTFAAASPSGTPSACDGQRQFSDLRADDPSVGPTCYTCPKGFTRGSEPVTSADACTKGSTDYNPAHKQHKIGCDLGKGEFFDPRKKGECWSCPKEKPRRTLYPVTSNKACATPIGAPEKLASARYLHKSKGCESGEFGDNGACWTCDKGYSRTVLDDQGKIEPVDSKKACVKTMSTKPADRVQSLPCASGFLDISTQKCWSCPKTHPLRTLNTIDSPMACTNNLSGLLDVSVDTQKTDCRKLVTEINKVITGAEDQLHAFEKEEDHYLAPVREPLKQRLDQLGDKVDTFTEPVRDEASRRLNSVAGPQVAFMRLAGESAGALRDGVLLNADVICSFDAAKIDAALNSAFKEARARLDADKASAVKSADVFATKTFFSVSLVVTSIDQESHDTETIGLTVVSNLKGAGGVYLSLGVGVTSSPALGGVSVSAMLFPDTTLDAFGVNLSALSGAKALKPSDVLPGITASVSKGENFLKQSQALSAILSPIDGLDVSWTANLDSWPPPPQALPTFGMSKDLVTINGPGESVLDVSLTMGWDFKLATWKP